MVTLSNEPPTLDRESTKHKYSRAFKEMIDMCLQKDPAKRPSTEKLLGHQFFRPAKRKDFLVSKILQHLPPLEERPHKRVQQKPITYTKGVTWDFAVDSEYRDNDDQEVEANEERSKGKQVDFSTTDNNSDVSNAATNVPPRKSRFFIGDAATESNVPLSSSSAPTTPPITSVTSQTPLSTPLVGTNYVSNPLPLGEKDEQNAQRQEIKKGRFSVESNGSRERLSGSQHESDNQRLSLTKESNENLTENSRKSRFEVQQTQPLDVSTLTTSVSQNISRENSVHSLSRESTLSKGNLLTSETTYSPQSTFLGHSPSISPSSSILRGQGQHLMSSNLLHSHVTALLHQNETQRIILNEILIGTSATATIAGRMAQPYYNSQQIPDVNGNTGGTNRNLPKEISSYLSCLDKQFQNLIRDNEVLRKENENLRRENEKLKRSTILNSIPTNNESFAINLIPTTPPPTKSTSNNISNTSNSVQ